MSPSRRRFLQFLAATPVLPYLTLSPDLRRALQAVSPAAAQSAGIALREDPLIASPADALSVFDFEPVARQNLPPAHFGYLATGTDDDGTLQANREGFARYQLRMRRLVDVRAVDTSSTLLGT